MKLNFQPGECGRDGAKIGDALLAREWMRLAGLPCRSSVRWNEGRIHAGQRDELGQEFFRACHGRRMSQPKDLCHFLLDTKMEKVQSHFVKKPHESHEDEYRRMEAAGTKSWFRRNRPWDIDPHDQHFLKDVFAQPWAPKNGNAIELGCGTGPLTRWLAKSGFKTTGVDVSETAIRMAREQSKSFTIDYRAADICTRDVRSSGKFDLCVDGRCFHGITNLKDRSAVLENVRLLLKPKGVFVLMSMCSPIDRGSLARQYPDQRILRNVIYYPLKKAGAFSGTKRINGQQYLPMRFLGHWKFLLIELRKAGLRPLLVRFNHCLPQEPVSLLNVAAVNAED